MNNFKENSGKWMVSDNEEIWSELEFFNTVEEAIKYGKEIYSEIYESFFIGKIQAVEIMCSNLGEDLLESIAIQHQNEHGEFAEDYLSSIVKEHLEILNSKLESLIAEWSNEFEYQPDYFIVECVETIDMEV